MREVRRRPRNEGPAPQRRQQAVQRRGQDLHQVRYSRISKEGAAGIGGEEVCG